MQIASGLPAEIDTCVGRTYRAIGSGALQITSRVVRRAVRLGNDVSMRSLVVSFLVATILCAVVGCGSEALPSETVACIPVPRFRVDGIDYEVQTNNDVVPLSDVGELVAENLTQPREIEECVPGFELADGETSLASGTDVFEIIGVDPAEALTASVGGSGESGRYLRFAAQP